MNRNRSRAALLLLIGLVAASDAANAAEIPGLANISPTALASTALLAAMTLFSAIGWLMRRQVMGLAWLSLIGLTGLAIHGEALFSASPLAGNLAIVALYVQVFACFGFAVDFFGLRPARTWIISAACAAAAAIAVHFAARSFGWDRLASSMMLGIACICLTALTCRQCLRSRRIEDVLASASLGLGLLCLSLDQATAANIWSGPGFLLSPYVSILTLGMLGFALVRRMIAAVAAKDTQNAMLEQRIERTKANLMISESARRSLEVSSAVTHERERMMREIHDGIGSSLVAALASAERQGKQSTTAVVALKSALTDLRIAVDSLEPVEGNVTTLLASLRYRIEPELKKSGIAIDWKVNEVPELDWLDSPNALHILRIFQEALGNTLGHANATRVQVICKMDLHDGRPGIRIELSDNGAGFDPAEPARGRGRKNMLDRAEALGGKLTVQSAPGSGSTTVLWLPFLRPRL